VHIDFSKLVRESAGFRAWGSYFDFPSAKNSPISGQNTQLVKNFFGAFFGIKAALK
jgi:hypothetical protein